MAVSDLLFVDGIAKSFGSTAVLEDTNLSIARGSFVSIVGPSGCGKSTLFNIVSGLIEPDRGSVSFEGREITGQTGHVGYMLQKDLLVPWRTVLGNIILSASLRGGAKSADRAEARVIADRYGLGEFLDHYPRSLSGGMRQRVALMRTLATNQPLLLLDEPFGALDSQTRLDMQQWLLSVWRDYGRTVLFVTHDVDESIFLSDRILVMSARPGRIVADISVPLARPRDLSTLTSPDFVQVKREILSLLHGGER